MLKKVNIQDPRYLKKNSGIKRRLFKDFINIGTTAIQFSCKPRHCTFLLLQLLPDKLTDMYHTQHSCSEDLPIRLFIITYRDYIKRDVGNQASAYPTLQALALPFKEDK